MSAPSGRQTTTAAAVKAALVDLFETVVDPTVTQVSYGAPGDGFRSELVVVGGVDYEDTDWSELGPSHHRDEKYAVQVVVSVTEPGGSQQPATERCFAIYQLLEQAVVALPDLTAALSPGSTQIFWCLPRPTRLAEGFNDQNGRLSNLAVAFNVYARI